MYSRIVTAERCMNTGILHSDRKAKDQEYSSSHGFYVAFWAANTATLEFRVCLQTRKGEAVAATLIFEVPDFGHYLAIPCCAEVRSQSQAMDEERRL